MANTVLSYDYVSCPCRLRTTDNSIISTGRIIEIDDEYVVIRMVPALRHVIPYSTNVKLTVLNDKLGHKSLMATVFASTTTITKLYDIKEAGEFEKRTYYRLNVTLEGQVTPLEPGMQARLSVDKDGDVKEDNRTEVRIKNISLSGVFFSGPDFLKLQDRISIDILTPMGKLSLLANVRRKNEQNNGDDCDYGCEFEPYSDKVEDALWKYMMHKELESIRWARGEWITHGSDS